MEGKRRKRTRAGHLGAAKLGKTNSALEDLGPHPANEAKTSPTGKRNPRGRTKKSPRTTTPPAHTLPPPDSSSISAGCRYNPRCSSQRHWKQSKIREMPWCHLSSLPCQNRKPWLPVSSRFDTKRPKFMTRICEDRPCRTEWSDHLAVNSDAGTPSKIGQKSCANNVHRGLGLGLRIKLWAKTQMQHEHMGTKTPTPVGEKSRKSEPAEIQKQSARQGGRRRRRLVVHATPTTRQLLCAAGNED